MNLRRRLLTAVALFVVVAAFAVAGYRLLGGSGVTLLQAVYMAVITLCGVGYEEVVNTSHHPALRLFNMFVVLIGVAITVYVFSAVTAFLVDGEIRHLFWRRKMQKRIGMLSNHYVVCGLGDTGRYAIEELHKTGTPYVVIESSEENLRRSQEHEGGLLANLPYVIGDATEDDILAQAGIDRAAGLIAAVPTDKDNLVITFMARQRNPNLRIVARCNDLKFTERMMRAGANSTVSPDHIGGLRMASEVLRPHVTSFLDMMLKEQTKTIRVDEIVIQEGSPWIGRSLESLDLRGRYNILPLAVKNTDVPSAQSYWVNPPDTLTISANAVVIVVGDVVEVRRARTDAGSKKGV